MKVRFITSLLLMAPALLIGQDKGTGATLIYPGPIFTEIKQYLSLTDAQIQSLQTILDSRSQATQNIYSQINQKNLALQQLLNSDSGSAAQIGQLMLDIHNLEKQVPLNDGTYKTQALNVLTADQKAKLPKLNEAFQLQGTAGQAASLLLIDYPRYIGLPALLTATGAATCAGTGLPAAGNGSAIGVLRSTPPNR